MEEMIRKQVYIEPRHERLLKERARRYRVTEADLIRQAIDRGLERTPTRAPDPEAWKQVERFIRRRRTRSEEHTSELQSPYDLVCRLLLEKKKQASRRRKN